MKILRHAPNEERVIREQIAPWLAEQGLTVAYEVELFDMTRPDLVTDKIVGEVKPEKLWAAGIGQLMLYAEWTGLDPVLFLMINDEVSQSRHVYRALAACKRVSIGVVIWNISTGKPVQAPGWPIWNHALQHQVGCHVRQPRPPKSK